MISRFFKRKPKAAPERKSEKAQPKKLLTAEGWKRLMMRKSGKKK